MGKIPGPSGHIGQDPERIEAAMPRQPGRDRGDATAIFQPDAAAWEKGRGQMKAPVAMVVGLAENEIIGVLPDR